MLPAIKRDLPDQSRKPHLRFSKRVWTLVPLTPPPGEQLVDDEVLAVACSRIDDYESV